MEHPSVPLMEPRLNPPDEGVLRMLVESNYPQTHALESPTWLFRSGGSKPETERPVRKLITVNHRTEGGGETKTVATNRNKQGRKDSEELKLRRIWQCIKYEL